MAKARRKTPFIKGHLLPQMMFFVAGIPKGSFVSIDVTSKCNLRCKHCYFFESEPTPELSTDEWEKRIKLLKKQYPFL